jgi:hypothetical protein
MVYNFTIHNKKRDRFTIYNGQKQGTMDAVSKIEKTNVWPKWHVKTKEKRILKATDQGLWRYMVVDVT